MLQQALSLHDCQGVSNACLPHLLNLSELWHLWLRCPFLKVDDACIALLACLPKLSSLTIQCASTRRQVRGGLAGWLASRSVYILRPRVRGART